MAERKEMSESSETRVTEAREKFEAAKLTRRQALSKVGLRFGAAALFALSIDDLARVAAAKLQEHAGDNRIANEVAREFKNAGVAFADPSGRPPCSNCTTEGPDGSTILCGATYCAKRMNCVQIYCAGGSLNDFYACLDGAKDWYNSNCAGGSGCPADPVDCDCQQSESC